MLVSTRQFGSGVRSQQEVTQRKRVCVSIMGDEVKNVETKVVANRESQLLELLATSAWLTGLPLFRGERNEDIQEFIKNFEDQTVGFDDKIRVLGIRRSFVGAAREWLNENCQTYLSSNDYDQLKKKILDRFSPESADLRYRKRLTQMKFDADGKETLASFIDRYVALAKRLGISSESEIVTGLLIAMPVEVQGDLEYLDNIGSIKTLASFKKIAQRYDSIVSKRSKSPEDLNKLGALVSSISKAELSTALTSIREEINKQHEEMLAAIRDRNLRNHSERNEETRMCYNCRKNGHLARNCQEPSRERQEKSDQRPNTSREKSPKRDYVKINQEARQEYERKYGKPETNCPICSGYHFVYHCPLKNLKD